MATHSKLPEMLLFRFIMIFFRLILFCIFSGLFSRGAHSWHLPHGRPAGSISRCVFPMAPRGMEGVGPDSPPPLPRRDIFIKKGGASPQRPTCSPNVSSYFKSLSDVEPNVGFLKMLTMTFILFTLYQFYLYMSSGKGVGGGGGGLFNEFWVLIKFVYLWWLKKKKMKFILLKWKN